MLRTILEGHTVCDSRRPVNADNGSVGSAPDEKAFHSVANRRDGCTMVPFSRSKRKSRFRCLELKSSRILSWPHTCTSIVGRREDQAQSHPPELASYDGL